jgi:hypothetical protein
LDPSEVEAIVNAYGAALAEPTALGIVRDIRTLPYSKGEIKTALILALGVTYDAAARENLRTAYITLADFQPLSETEVRALQLWNSAPSHLSADLAKRLVVQGELVSTVQRRIADEANLLAQELEAEGFW